MLTYHSAAEADIARWERNAQKLSPHQKSLVPSQEAKFVALREGVQQNQQFLRNIAMAFQEPSLIQGA